MFEHDYKDAEIISKYETTLRAYDQRVMDECKRLGYDRRQMQEELYTNTHLLALRKVLADFIATRTTIKFIINRK